MVFGIITTSGNLRDEIFCLTEERNFFRSKLLESVSEITALQKELQAQKREVDRLRRDLLNQCTKNLRIGYTSVSDGEGTEKLMAKPDTEESTMSSTAVSMHTHDGEDDDDEDDAGNHSDSAKDIRQSAQKLLQWASYRSSLRPTLSSDSRDERHPIESITLVDDGESEEEDEEESDVLTVDGKKCGDEETKLYWGDFLEESS